ncbi:acyl carrier protein [Nostoc sp. CHAB 5836]|uniref:acyl carrier protein n=1 Tax=Nostoc sp. CHAB 5836 TaxID=2780404 RepID=UPI0034D96072|nr:acyl carrier protein [Nostoc sp. CHAB 5836]
MRVSTVLGLSKNEVVSPQQGFFDMGMDSLTSTELRNLIQTDFNLENSNSRFPNSCTLYCCSCLITSKVSSSSDSPNQLDSKSRSSIPKSSFRSMRYSRLAGDES